MADHTRQAMYTAAFVIAIGTLWTAAWASRMEAALPNVYNRPAVLPHASAAPTTDPSIAEADDQ